MKLQFLISTSCVHTCVYIHKEHTQFTLATKLHCIAKIQLNLPFQPATTISYQILFLFLYTATAPPLTPSPCYCFNLPSGNTFHSWNRDTKLSMSLSMLWATPGYYDNNNNNNNNSNKKQKKTKKKRRKRRIK